MTTTFAINPDGRLWTAPEGADPSDATAWTHIGYVSEVTFETSDDQDVPLPKLPANTTVTVPVRLIRHLLPPQYAQCERTLRAIEKHALRERITSLLADALASALLPCPSPYPARAARRTTKSWRCPPHF